jgi:hypothetical protein
MITKHCVKREPRSSREALFHNSLITSVTDAEQNMAEVP